MKQFKKFDRVTTRHGAGIILDIEEHLDLREPIYRYGVKHDQFPERMEYIRHALINDLLYYFDRELIKL